MNKLARLIDLTGRVGLITGATGYLGRVVAATFAELGARLILVDRPGSEFESINDELYDFSDKIILNIHCDLESEVDRAQLAEKVCSTVGQLDILVNNAAFVGTSGLQGWSVSFENQTVETWRRAIEVNLTASFDICKRLSALMQNSGNAAVINVGSIYGHLGPNWSLYEGTSMANPAAYAASKGGLIQLTRWLATTLAPSIRVNSISPGGIGRNQPKDFVDRYMALTPLKRMATEEDFIGAFAYLASDLSRYVTGQDLLVDGGWSAW